MGHGAGSGDPRTARGRRAGSGDPRTAGAALCFWRFNACLIALIVLITSSTSAQELSDTQAVEAGREALDGKVTFPWYDADADGIQRLNVEPPDDVRNRGSKWERTIKAQQASRPWSMPNWLRTMLEVVGWTLLVMALVAVGYFLVRAFLIAEVGGVGGGAAFTDGVMGPGDIDRVESLPFQLKAPQSDLVSEARRHYEAGNYNDAIIYLYSYQLVELDKHQLIRLTKGKTNRQYLREVRRRGDLFGTLQASMLAFEDVFFGNHPLERSRFESCWSGLEAFHRSLEQATA